MKLLSLLLEIYTFIIIIRVVLSWVRPWPRTQIEVRLYQITEPVFDRVRRIIPPMGGLDLAPIVVIIAISIIRNYLLQ